ncbi:hypothetical protein [Fibrella forsythiae]|uniref:hypothetical protein n=1 Tax=Fibrella forsythiae TaxID=2817061 RepID=UPI001E33C031|nr:hypothetical protein [Fibrella forsythiae]
MKPSARSKTRLLQTQLLELLESMPSLLVNQPEAWDINGPQHFLRQGYRVHYLPTEVMAQFAPFAGQNFEKVKLINYLQPAVKLTYYDKHKYWLIKSPQIGALERQTEIDRYLSLLEKQQGKLLSRQLDILSPGGETRLQQQLSALEAEQTLWQQIRDQPQAWELVMSTYYSEYRYWYISWKYHLDALTFDNATAHLLSPIRDRSGQILSTKLNVVFVDTGAILLTHDHQHKQIADYLAGFPVRSHDLKGQLFARPILPTQDTDQPDS